MNNTNGYIFISFAAILILPLTSLASGHFYLGQCFIIMKKISDDRMICVYEKTAEKLTQRGYANVMDEHYCIHHKYYTGKTPGVICFETEKEMWDKSNSLCRGKLYRGGLCFGDCKPITTNYF